MSIFNSFESLLVYFFKKKLFSVPKEQTSQQATAYFVSCVGWLVCMDN